MLCCERSVFHSTRLYSVWYNARIEKVLADGICEILFMDYGNTDKVQPGEIV